MNQQTSWLSGSLTLELGWQTQNLTPQPHRFLHQLLCCPSPVPLGTLGIQSLIKTPPPNMKGKLHSEGRHSRNVPASGGPGACFPACGMQYGDRESAHPLPAQGAAHCPATLSVLHSIPSCISSSYFLFLNSQIES